MNREHQPEFERIPAGLRSLNWQPWTIERDFENGDELLLAVPVLGKQGNRWRYTIESVVVDCDEHYFNFERPDGSPWEGVFEDCDFFVLIRNQETEAGKLLRLAPAVEKSRDAWRDAAEFLFGVCRHHRWPGR